jgi:hypothetical protein
MLILRNNTGHRTIMRLLFRGSWLRWTLALLAGPVGVGAQIQVGATVHVSAALPDRAHTEYSGALDPARPQEIMICSMMLDQQHNRMTSGVYRSSDGGGHWRPAMDDPGSRSGDSWDPACAFGTDGSAYFATLWFPSTKAAAPAADEMRVFKLNAAGDKRAVANSLPVLHNEFLTVDHTREASRGSVYIVGVGDWTDSAGRPHFGVLLRYSTDSGHSFNGPVDYSDSAAVAMGAGPGLVNVDGTLLIPIQSYHLSRTESQAPATSVVMVAPVLDAGARIGAPSIVARTRGCTDQGSATPFLAVDQSRGPFRGRLYAVFNDRSSGRCRVMLAHSRDGGVTWSKSITVDDAAILIDTGRGPDAFLPSIAVNSTGVVGISWYDRSEDPDRRRFRLRFAASMDGGESVGQSVGVGSAAHSYDAEEGFFGLTQRQDASQRNPPGVPDGIRLQMITGGPYRTYFFAGDYGCLLTSADGRFHPVWVDSRTGIPQLYTAPIRVSGRASHFGVPAYDALSDLSGDVKLTVISSTYNAKERSVQLVLQLENGSARSIHLPLVLQPKALSSVLGVPRLKGPYAGGIVSGLSAIDGVKELLPGAVSAPISLTFVFDRFTPLRGQRPRNTIVSLLDVVFRVLGTSSVP